MQRAVRIGRRQRAVPAAERSTSPLRPTTITLSNISPSPLNVRAPRPTMSAVAVSPSAHRRFRRTETPRGTSGAPR
jgi:hypothetical protein